MPSKTIVAIVAVAAIVITCIVMHVDGTIVFCGLTLIAGLGGYALGKTSK